MAKGKKREEKGGKGEEKERKGRRGWGNKGKEKGEAEGREGQEKGGEGEGGREAVGLDRRDPISDSISEKYRNSILMGKITGAKDNFL